MKPHSSIFLAILMLVSCGMREGSRQNVMTSCGYARYFDIIDGGGAVVTVSPYDGSRDTVVVSSPMDNIVCMSTSGVAALAEIGADSVITAVSGVRYISNPSLRMRYAGTSSLPKLYDIGYDSSLDYERILSLKPDLVTAYAVSGVEPPYLSKLRDLGVPVLVLHDHLEDHPLARAEYVRLFGALTGRMSEADSAFSHVRDRYEALAENTAGKQPGERCRVLLNIPYGDAWYVPGAESYMSRLIRDAGGEVAGAEEGTSASGVISVEKAYVLSQDADVWLNPGHCRTREELREVHQLFERFGPMAKGLPIYNNTLRSTPEGGNDFWESGAMRPDLILEDLVAIFSASDRSGMTLEYYLEVK